MHIKIENWYELVTLGRRWNRHPDRFLSAATNHEALHKGTTKQRVGTQRCKRRTCISARRTVFPSLIGAWSTRISKCLCPGARCRSLSTTTTSSGETPRRALALTVTIQVSSDRKCLQLRWLFNFGCEGCITHLLVYSVYLHVRVFWSLKLALRASPGGVRQQQDRVGQEPRRRRVGRDACRDAGPGWAGQYRSRRA